MDNEFLQTIVALLPFVILLLGFLVFKMNALRLSLYVWLLEIFAVVVFFHMPVQKTLTASVWGNITIWNGFLVLWTDRFLDNVLEVQVLEYAVEYLRSGFAK